MRGIDGLRFGAALIACLSAPAVSQTAPQAAQAESAQGDVAVTIYNNDLAMVQDVRRVPFGSGRVRTEFPDVSARIQSETVSFVAANTTILEQNFDYSLLSPDALMQAAVGQEITIIRTNPATGAETRQRARVLAANGGVVLQVGDTIEVLRDDGLPVRAIFDRIPPGLRARPTLSITVNSDRAGTREASLRYLTRGIGWRADYVALFDQASGRLDVQGWVTLTNQSGTPYVNAMTRLVAGSPNSSGGCGEDDWQCQQRQQYYQQQQRQLQSAGTETAGRERLGDFYVYPLPQRTTIASNQTKQVSFLDVQGVPARREYEFQVNGWQSMTEAQSATTTIAFSTSADGGLGDALPAGTMRFYQRDREGAPQFVGESNIGHTPMGSRLSLTTGAAFDVKVQPVLVSTERITAQQWQTTARTTIRIPGRPPATATTEVLERRPYTRRTMRYVLTNARPEAVEINLTQIGLDWWYDATKIVSEPIEGRTVINGERRWTIPVPANGTREFVVVYDTRY
jgi:hypothetical protein